MINGHFSNFRNTFSFLFCKMRYKSIEWVEIETLVDSINILKLSSKKLDWIDKNNFIYVSKILFKLIVDFNSSPLLLT